MYVYLTDKVHLSVPASPISNEFVSWSVHDLFTSSQINSVYINYIYIMHEMADVQLWSTPQCHFV